MKNWVQANITIGIYSRTVVSHPDRSSWPHYDAVSSFKPVLAVLIQSLMAWR